MIKKATCLILVLLTLSFFACKKTEYSVDFTYQNDAFRITKQLPNLDATFTYQSYEYVNELRLYTALYAYNENQSEDLVLQEIEEYLAQEYEEDGSLRIYTNGKNIRIYNYVEWARYLSNHFPPMTTDPGAQYYFFLHAFIYSVEKNVLKNLPATFDECTVENLIDLTPYVTLANQNNALFALYDYGDEDPRSNLPSDYIPDFGTMYIYYSAEEIIPEALALALQKYKEASGVEITFEEIEEFMASETEKDGSMRLYNNGMHPRICGYVRWFLANFYPSQIMLEVFPPEPEADSFSGSAVSV